MYSTVSKNNIFSYTSGLPPGPVQISDNQESVIKLFNTSGMISENAKVKSIKEKFSTMKEKTTTNFQSCFWLIRSLNETGKKVKIQNELGEN